MLFDVGNVVAVFYTNSEQRTSQWFMKLDRCKLYFAFFQVLVGVTSPRMSILGDPKTLSLIVLTVQNTSLVLAMKMSLLPSATKYLASVVVFADEILKLIFCILMLAWVYWKAEGRNGYTLVSSTKDISTTETRSGIMGYFQFMKSECFRTKFDFFKMCVPAICYAVQKNLLFVAVNNLDAAVFQVAYQGKILTTAMFSVIMLGKRLTKRQVFGLVVLLIGVALVQLSSVSDTSSHGEHNLWIGTVAVLSSCLISGFAAIYFEWILSQLKPHRSPLTM
jgi:UDP-sugar transporter A1/2/3